MTGERDYGKKEWELIGDKVNALKELALELKIPILTACQLNRAAESGVDDSSAIAQSDRLQWFASFLAISRRKTVTESNEHGLQFGTHILIPLKFRFEGRDAFGHHDLVEIVDDEGRTKLVQNFINYSIKDFRISEMGTLRSIMADKELRPILPPGPEDPLPM